LMKLDKLDLAILRRLVRDGRVPFLDLAKELKVPDTTIHFRVRRLRERGVLGGFTARVDPSAIGLKGLALLKVKLAPPPTLPPAERLEPLVLELGKVRLDRLSSELQKLEEVGLIATSIESGVLIAMIAASDWRKVEEVVELARRGGGEVEVIKLSELTKGSFPL